MTAAVYAHRMTFVADFIISLNNSQPELPSVGILKSHYAS